MTKLDDKLREIVEDGAESYYPLHEYGDQPIYTDQNKVTLDEAVEQIKQAFADEGYVSPENAKKAQDMVNQIANLAAAAFHMPTIQYVKPNKAMTKVQNLMTGQDFYDKFVAEYHNKADWIAADETMGDDAEHDVLLCAKLAAGLTND